MLTSDLRLLAKVHARPRPFISATSTNLPNRPDYEKANALLLKARRMMT